MPVFGVIVTLEVVDIETYVDNPGTYRVSVRHRGQNMTDVVQREIKIGDKLDFIWSSRMNLLTLHEV